jgi:hypothetical protein
MSATESARHALYSQLQEVLGDDHADTLMAYLPHHRSDEAATKADIADLRADMTRLEDRFDRLEDRFDRLEDIVREQQRFYVGTMMASMTALTTAFSVVVLLLG